MEIREIVQLYNHLTRNFSLESKEDDYTKIVKLYARIDKLRKKSLSSKQEQKNNPEERAECSICL